MDVIKSPVECRKRVLTLRQAGKNVVFVPTMGALHEGHLALVRRARDKGDVVVVSIFVNPAQFNNPDDFQKYPKTPEPDRQVLEAVGCNILFEPAVHDMYPQASSVKIQFPLLEATMEGVFRPGHFEGVALVVAKLFHIVPANMAVFGQKDWQQALIIRQLAIDLSFDIQIDVAPTVRETSGLALSSRNKRLTADQLARAAVFYQSLVEAAGLLLKGAGIEEVKKKVAENFSLTDGVTLEYFEVANRETLRPVSSVVGNGLISLFIAGYMGPVRLIDNIFLEEVINWKNAN